MIKTRVEIELIFIGLNTRISTQNRFVYITVQLNIVLGWCRLDLEGGTSHVLGAWYTFLGLQWAL